ncbi:MAG: hypothetical protein ACOYBY_07825 [Dermatophilaceae bacterium]
MAGSHPASSAARRTSATLWMTATAYRDGWRILSTTARDDV